MYATDIRHPNPALAEKLAALFALNRNRPTGGFALRPAYLDLLAALGNPQDRLPPVVHVAGTNGKGSTVATLRAILGAAGYRGHVYTSPHLQRFNERIVLAGDMITDDQLEPLIDEILGLAREEEPLTFFEATTALAFAAFARTPADVVLLETGLGGRLDCTNIVSHPAATVITKIGFDHMEFLGTTLPAIAAEKAGIMKRGSPCVIAPQSDPAAGEVFERRAQELGVSLSRGGVDWIARPGNNDTMIFEYESDMKTLPRPVLVGAHQIENAGSALACLRFLKGFSIKDQDIERGLRSVTWPGRLQRLDQGRLSGLLPANGELWIDGGHNEDAAQALASQINFWNKADRKSTHMILGMLSTKAPDTFLAPLLPQIESLWVTEIPDESKSFTAKALAERAVQAGAKTVHAEPDPLKALIKISETMTPGVPGRILVTGSLYLIGHLLSLNGK